MAVTLDIDKLNTFTDARILISAGNFKDERNFIAIGFITGEFSVGGNNEFKSLFEFSAQAALQDLTQTIGALTGIDSLAKFRVQTVEQTVQSWVSSGIPSFTVPMIFVALKPGDDVRAPIRNLSTTVYPTFSGDDGGTIRPPLDYSIDFGSKADGTIAVQIGNWFRAPQQIMKSINFTLSKEITEDGFPLFAQGQIEFQPFRMISTEIFQSYLIAGDLSTQR